MPSMRETAAVSRGQTLRKLYGSAKALIPKLTHRRAFGAVPVLYG